MTPFFVLKSNFFRILGPPLLSAFGAARLFVRFLERLRQFRKVERDDAQPHVALERSPSFPEASFQPLPSHESLNDPFDSSAEFLELLEPALPLETFSFLRSVSGLFYGHPFYAFFTQKLLVLHAVISPVGPEMTGGHAVLPDMVVQNTLQRGIVSWIAFQNLELGDQAAFAGDHRYLVAEFGRALALAPFYYVRVFFENGYDLVLRRDLFAFQNPAFALAYRHGGQFDVFFKLVAARGGVQDLAGLQLLQAFAGHCEHLDGNGQKLHVQALAFLFRAFALGHHDLVAFLFVSSRSFVKRKLHVGSVFPAFFHNPGQHPHAVVQEPGVDWIRDVGFRHRSVGPRVASVFDLADLGVFPDLPP